jgi:hypothetical protein
MALRFLHNNLAVPFTNSAEREIRRSKLRSAPQAGAGEPCKDWADFAVIWSYLSTTTAKHGIDALDALTCK